MTDNEQNHPEENSGVSRQPDPAEQPAPDGELTIPEQPAPAGESNTPEQPGAPGQPELGRYVAFRRINVGVKPGYILRKVGQAYMVMPTGPRMKEYQGMITLNETGAFLFKLAQDPDVTKESLIEACKTEYGATDEEANEAVTSFIGQCAECGLFEYETLVIDRETGQAVTEDDVRQ